MLIFRLGRNSPTGARSVVKFRRPSDGAWSTQNIAPARQSVGASLGYRATAPARKGAQPIQPADVSGDRKTNCNGKLEARPDLLRNRGTLTPKTRANGENATLLRRRVCRTRYLGSSPNRLKRETTRPTWRRIQYRSGSLSTPTVLLSAARWRGAGMQTPAQPQRRPREENAVALRN